MKTRFVVVSIVVSVALLCMSFASAQDKTRSRPSAEEEITRIERDASQALIKGDFGPFNRATAPTCLFTDASGHVTDKASVIASLKSGGVKYKSEQLENMKVRVYGDCAVVHFRSDDTFSVNGHDVSGVYQWTATFAKLGGHWQLVADQSTAVAAK